MPASALERALRAARVATSLTLLAAAGAHAGSGSETAPQQRTGLILSGVPAHDSEAYRTLTTAAGNPVIRPLDMTHSEMWSVSPERVDDIRSAAGKIGVSVMTLDQTSNHAMTPMASGAMTEQQTSMSEHAMSSKAAMGMSMMTLPDAKVLEYALTKEAVPTPGADKGAEIVIPLGEGKNITARRSSVEKTSDGYIWHGVVDTSGEPVTLMWWPSGRLSGQITYQGHRFIIRHMGGEMHGIVEMAPRMLPPEHAPMGKAMQEKMHMSTDPLVTKGDASMLRDGEPGDSNREGEPLKNLKDSGARTKATLNQSEIALNTPDAATETKPNTPASPSVVISLLVAYTARAAAQYTDIEKDLVALAVEEANQSFRNSGIGNVKLELVHTYRTDYVESGTHFEHVFRFADKGDGFMDEVHALRDEKKADIALLIVDDANGCGLAAGVAPAADRAFAVIHHECAALSYSLAHEIGHIIGARHDIGLDDSTAPHAHGHGYVFGQEWRTMMSYEESCGGCPRLPIWSNPHVLVRGVPAGNTSADNARVIAEEGKRVSQFK